MDKTYSIFGNEVAPITRTRSRGLFLSANRKYGNAYMSSEAKEMIFGKDATSGSLIVICSHIEKNWYIAKSSDPTKGYECKLNEQNAETSIRVNGMQKIVEKIATTFNYKEDKITFKIDPQPIPYEGLNLHKITINK